MTNQKMPLILLGHAEGRVITGRKNEFMHHLVQVLVGRKHLRLQAKDSISSMSEFPGPGGAAVTRIPLR